uniref:Uncharacterized protein n=1 Tax=Kalanchoe fedtschenkoi TaxID=63787 RepID=A0A7N0T1Z7_KALFE
MAYKSIMVSLAVSCLLLIASVECAAGQRRASAPLLAEAPASAAPAIAPSLPTDCIVACDLRCRALQVSERLCLVVCNYCCDKLGGGSGLRKPRLCAKLVC